MTSPLLRVTFLMLLCCVAVPATAQNLVGAGDAESSADDPTASWYSESSSAAQPTPRMIIQQKAQMRAYQRMARMESMKWYGMSASRPLANATPFAGVPSPRWQMPGGRPFAWTPYRTTNVVIVR